MIKQTCECGRLFTVSDKMAGKTVQCPDCEQTFTLQATPETTRKKSEQADTKSGKGNSSRKKSRLKSPRLRNRSAEKKKKRKRKKKGGDSKGGNDGSLWKGLALGMGAILLLIGGVGIGYFISSGTPEETRQQLQELQKTVKKKQKDIKTLENTINNKDGHIDTLEKEREDRKKKLEKLTRKAEQKDEKIERARKQDIRYRKQISALEQRIKKLNREGSNSTVSNIVKNVRQTVAVVKTNHGNGAGFFITETGFLVTNYHVIRGASQIRLVVTWGGQKQIVKARPYAVDIQHDLALLKVRVNGRVPNLSLLQQENYRVGEQVIAIGSPGVGNRVLENTVSTGIISNLSTTMNGTKFIQTSAAVNPGNSGGPLLNMKGQAIGVVTAKAQNAENIGFAIPASTVHLFYQRRNTGKFRITGSLADFEREKGIARRQQTSKPKTKGGIPVNTTISDMVTTAHNNLIYALDYDNNSLLVLDPEKEKVIKKKFVGSNPVYITNSTNNQYLWVANQGSKKVVKIAKHNYVIEEKIKIDKPPTSLFIENERIWYATTGGNLYLALPDFDKNFKLLTASKVAPNPGTNTFWVVDHNELIKFNRDGLLAACRKLGRLRKTRKFQKDYSYRRKVKNSFRRSLRKMQTSVYRGLTSSPEGRLIYRNDQNRLYYGRKILSTRGGSISKAGDLKRNPYSQSGSKAVRDFMKRYSLDSIAEISPNGKWAVDGTHIYNTKTFTVEKELPIPSVVQTFSSDSNKLWLFDPFNQKILSVDVNTKARAK